MASLPDNLYKGVLDRCLPRFVEDLDPGPILDLFLEDGFIPFSKVRDIRERRLSSEKTREILEQVRSKGVKGYETFKEFLIRCNQKPLADYLTDQETSLKTEMAVSANQESARQNRRVHYSAPRQTGNQRIPNDRELLSIASHIGMNWEMLGPFLGIPSYKIDQIKMDNTTTVQRIYRMLLVWRSMNAKNATFENLLALMNRAPGAINIDMDALNDICYSVDRRTEGAADERPQQQMHNIGEATDQIRQLHLGQPTVDTQNQDIKNFTASGFSSRHPQGYQQFQYAYGDSVSASDNNNNDNLQTRQQQNVQESSSYSPSLAALQGNFGNTSVISLNGTGRPQVTTSSAADETDAVSFPSDVDMTGAVQQPGFLIRQQSGDTLSAKLGRDQRLKKIFQSDEDIKGRLKVLSAENIEDFLESCGQKPKYKGGFGDIYVSEEKIPGLDMRIVVKKVNFEEDEAEQKMRSLTSEKLCARAMHFAIVPLLGIREDIENKTYYFLSPYMENETLNKVIEEDNRRLKQDERPELLLTHRLKIMYQIASAIDFLHTPVKDIRGMIVHRDIKSLNIVLDNKYNARLIDFGLAREMKEGHDNTKTTSIYPTSAGYGKLTQLQTIIRHDDYRNFGVVIRELLTGKKPSIEGCPEEDLFHQTRRRIKLKSLEMWKMLETEPSVLDTLVDLSEKCIKDRKLTSEKVVTTIKDLLPITNTPRWEADSQSERCEMCLLYNAVKKGEKVLTHKKKCPSNIKVCVSCIRSSYCNPIRCHSCDEPSSIDTTVYPSIGYGWAALLIAGDDSNVNVAKSFEEDINKVKKVITSKCPLVMGVSVDNVKVITPDNDMKGKQEESMKEKIKLAVENLQMVENIDTLLVYISGHFKPDKGGFELKSEDKYLSITQLNGYISNVFARATKKRAIVFLDCCSAPAVTVEKVECCEVQSLSTESGNKNSEDPGLTSLAINVPDIKIVQINACRKSQKAVIEPGGSLFTKFLLQGLTRVALGIPCDNVARCQDCKNDMGCKINGDFVTAEKLTSYVQKHLDCVEKTDIGECVMNSYNASHIDVTIGYVINFKADLQFIYRFGEKIIKHDEIPQRMFQDIRELQVVLFDRYKEKMGLDKQEVEPELKADDFSEILCIEVEKGPKKHHRDRLTSLERVMAAWNAKRELVVSLRTVHEISEGIVGAFLPIGQTVQPILYFLHSSHFAKSEEKDYASIYAINMGALDALITDLEKIKQTGPISKFLDHLIDIESAVHQLDTLEKGVLKELCIVFPCATVDGSRKYRSDFLCYQLKEDTDL